MIATLQVTIVWALWHFPRFLSDGAFAATFLAFTIALSVLLTFAWARLRGGIALAAVVHGSANAPFFFFDGRFTNDQAFQAFAWATALLAVIAGAVLASRWRWWTTRPGQAPPV
jgi:C4-dicarboxylate transporter